MQGSGAGEWLSFSWERGQNFLAEGTEFPVSTSLLDPLCALGTTPCPSKGGKSLRSSGEENTPGERESRGMKERNGG